MEDLRPLRQALLEMHKELLVAQRIEVERFGGRMSASETLQAATDDMRFSWLKAISELIADIDSSLGDADADVDVDVALIERARRLFAPPDPATAFGARYLRALQDHPEVVMAHRDVVAILDRLR